MGVANEKRSPDPIPNFLDKVGLSLALSPALSIPLERTHFLTTTFHWIHTEIPAFVSYLEKCDVFSPYNCLFCFAIFASSMGSGGCGGGSAAQSRVLMG